ncbi:alpha/beta hydrolase [Paenalkalicoccus suaedae]|uniref:Alpha/beta hydrolase n=1 Tax=Paenalkalicoccus suaedae TaxID=2592382 RepID=A0A859FED3_9BACI|nr:alpha/beta hydrolase [Paenalkalicoccus suaedae]QKS71208.1 alpha/beta hydrolase [Paenalkalicoccus suaedae]
MRDITFKYSDKKSLPLYYKQAKEFTNTAVLCIHGVTSEMDAWDTASTIISEKANVDCYMPILRGYDDAPVGDLKKKGQFDSDIHDLLTYLYNRYTNVIAIGHSMGSGNLLRYLSTYNDTRLKHTIFTAPFFHPALNTFYKEEEQDRPEDMTYTVYYNKVMAIGILDRLKLPLFHTTTVVEIPHRKVPYDVNSKTSVKKLSFRLMISRFIENPAKIPSVPLDHSTVLVGRFDQIVHPELLTTYWTSSVGRDVTIAEGADHNSILSSKELLETVKKYAG